MPAFQDVPKKAVNQGMWWNGSPDTIPQGKVAYARNVRNYQAGQVTNRPGLTKFATVGSGAYVHSMTRLNNKNPGVNFTSAYVFGEDSSLFAGRTTTAGDFTNATINPVKLPPSGGTATLSGNPLTFADSLPADGGSPWLYCGDANLNFAAGYYPGDSQTPSSGFNNGMIRAISMGMKPPVWFPAITVHATGLLTGAYQWIAVFRRQYTGARSNPSAATRVTQSSPTQSLTSQYVSFTLPTTPIDPQTGSADGNVKIDVYRFGGTVFSWRYVGTGNSGDTFTDNIPDSGLLSAAEPSQATDPVTGITRFNLFQPWVTQDIAQFNGATKGTITQDGTTGIWTLTAGGTDTFKLGILQGSEISLTDSVTLRSAVYTIYQVRSSTVIELTEDLTGTFVSGSANVAWAIPAGTLVMGQPLPYLWGPFGLGQTGAVLFAVGDPNNPGVIYWTNGNDPDSTDIVNSLQITSGSEPMQAGCLYDGASLAWSTDRQFQIFANAVIQGQFYAQEIPSGKGVWMPYSLTVQESNESDLSVSWRGKDGIYDYSNSGGLVRLSSPDLYPFFPHDDQAGVALSSIFPTLLLGTDAAPPDDSQPKYQRLMWFDRILYYDYRSTAGVYDTLVYDQANGGGWVSLDHYAPGGVNGPVARAAEIDANNLLVGNGGSVYDFTGTSDASTAIVSVLFTAHDVQGSIRSQTLYGDIQIDANAAGATTITVTPLYALGASAGTAFNFASPTRTQTTFDLGSNGLGVLASSIGWKFSWTNTSTQAVIFGWVYSMVPKPDFTLLRATDKTDDGTAGAKYLRGVIVEANTSGTQRTINILVDDMAVTSFPVKTADQLEVPFGLLSPVVGYEFQLQPVDSSQWELFQVRWIWDPWPDLATTSSPWMNGGMPTPKYIRGFRVPMETGGVAARLQFADDAGNVTTFPAVTGPVGRKSEFAFAFTTPVITHQFQFRSPDPARVWWGELELDAEPWPEIVQEVSPVLNCGTSRLKFMQGAVIPIDTNGMPVTLQFLNDAGTVVFTSPTIQTTGKGSASVSWPPFLTHEIQIVPSGPVRIWYGEIAWIYEPAPELATTWVTPFTSHGIRGWFHQRSAWVAYVSSASVTFARVYPLGAGYANESYTLPSSSGVYIRSFVPLLPAKFPALQYQATSPNGFQLFEQDTEFDTREWGADGPYQRLRPVGSASLVKGADI